MRNEGDTLTPNEIKQLRLDFGLAQKRPIVMTQAAFARYLRLRSAATVNRWETGRTAPLPATMNKLLRLRERTPRRVELEEVTP
mgnify:CR=1 FL=1